MIDLYGDMARKSVLEQEVLVINFIHMKRSEIQRELLQK